jgi:hypothetical protein
MSTLVLLLSSKSSYFYRIFTKSPGSKLSYKILLKNLSKEKIYVF